jgi:hypothetical protein
VILKTKILQMLISGQKKCFPVNIPKFRQLVIPQYNSESTKYKHMVGRNKLYLNAINFVQLNRNLPAVLPE